MAKSREIWTKLRVDSKTLDKDLKTAQGKYSTATKRMETSANRASVATNRISKAVKGVGAAVIAAGLLRAGKAAVDLALRQEAAEKKLTAALGRRSQKLFDVAAALQKQTAYGDEAIIEAQALIGMFVKEESQIIKLTGAVLDLAAAKEMDLKTAADLVTKTVASSTNALSRYGITVEGAAGSTKRIASAVDNINKAFGGQAVAQLDTYAGRMQQVENKVGDVGEKLGLALLPLLETGAEMAGGFADGLLKISDALDKLDTSENKTLFKNLFELARVGAFMGSSEGDFIKYTPEEVALLKEAYGIKEGMNTNQERAGFGRARQGRIKTGPPGLPGIDVGAPEDIELSNPFIINEAAKNATLQNIQFINATELGYIANAYKYKNEMESNFHQTLTDNLDRLFYQQLNAASQLGWALEDAFSRSGDSLLSSLNQALQIALQISAAVKAMNNPETDGFAGILGLAGSIVPGLGLLGGLFGLHDGGTVTNIGGHVNYSPIPKFANGTDFIVPPGYNNDSFPMMVESGERVTVTPANRSGSDGNMNALVNRIDVMTANIVEIMKPRSQDAIQLFGEIGDNAIYLSNKRYGKIAGRIS